MGGVQAAYLTGVARGASGAFYIAESTRKFSEQISGFRKVESLFPPKSADLCRPSGRGVHSLEVAI